MGAGADACVNRLGKTRNCFKRKSRNLIGGNVAIAEPDRISMFKRGGNIHLALNMGEYLRLID